MRTRLLLLADSRLPAGGHAHSGGLEPAVSAGVVADLPGLADFLRGRLHTSGLTAAALAATACAHTARLLTPAPTDAEAQRDERARPDAEAVRDGWARLDAEADARTPSPAQRQASRAQGRSLLRAARTAWPHPVLDGLRAALAPAGPHHPVVLGATTSVAGGGPGEAAAIVAYGAVTGPASAAVRLLGLDPLAVHRTLAGLAGEVDAVAAAAAACAADGWAALPAVSAPVLDLFAELHLAAELRLFES